jgi:hypothetical protein
MEVTWGHRKQELFVYKYPLHSVLLPTKDLEEKGGALLMYIPQATVAILTTETSL